MKDYEFLNKIITLINSKKEGEYWDFKEQHHNNKADLLHDILCMSNNRADRDAYIIFGVSDDFEIRGVNNDENKRNQQQIIDFLKSKSFSGDIKPIIELHNFQFEKSQIDVLTIKNSDDTPYFIREDYQYRGRRVRANHIYTRIGDTNTDIDKSADINHIEYLWKKRFKINRSPLEQIKYKLQFVEEWNEREGDQVFHHKFQPEFTLKLESDGDRGKTEFYSYTMMNTTTEFGSLKVCYFGTTLFSHQFTVLDGGRLRTTVPEWGLVDYGEYNEKNILYKYYIVGTINYLLHKLLTGKNDEALIANKNLYSVIVIFKSALEKDSFEAYLRNRISEFKSYFIQEKDSYNWIVTQTKQEKKHEINRLKTGKVINKMLKQFRSKRKSS